MVFFYVFFKIEPEITKWTRHQSALNIYFAASSLEVCKNISCSYAFVWHMALTADG